MPIHLPKIQNEVSKIDLDSKKQTFSKRGDGNVHQKNLLFFLEGMARWMDGQIDRQMDGTQTGRWKDRIKRCL